MILLRLLLGSVVTAALVACAGPEAGTISFAEANATSGSDDPKEDDDATEPAGDPVFLSSKFAPGSPPNGPAKGKAEHSAVPAPGNATNDPSGVDCMSCHASTFAFAGTVYSDISGGARVAGAEIRVTGPDGKPFASAFSDADGNFWVPSTGAPIPEKSRVGVRSGTKSINMTGVIGGASGARCNNATGCHGSASFRVYLN